MITVTYPLSVENVDTDSVVKCIHAHLQSGRPILGGILPLFQFDACLDKVSHSIESVYLDQGIFLEVKILDTPEGKRLSELHKNLPIIARECPLKFYPRGLGVIGEEGRIMEDLISIDACYEKLP